MTNRGEKLRNKRKTREVHFKKKNPQMFPHSVTRVRSAFCGKPPCSCLHVPGEGARCRARDKAGKQTVCDVQVAGDRMAAVAGSGCVSLCRLISLHFGGSLGLKRLSVQNTEEYYTPVSVTCESLWLHVAMGTLLPGEKRAAII